MKSERTKNASRNIVFGTLLKLYQIFFPFLIRTVMIYFLGVEYVGLNSLFSSVLQVLNLAELGVGSAMIFSMYKPISEDDTVTICALMRLYKIYYRIIGFVILGLGLLLLPFIPRLINGAVPDNLNIYTLYLLNLGATVFSYWLFAYKNCLLTAYQRVDVISKIQLVTSTIQYTLQIIAIIFIKDYYVFLLIALLIQIINNVMTAKMSDKMYPSCKAVGALDSEYVRQINQRVKDLFTAKIGGVIVNSVDSIVISAFLGLTALAIYQNYFYILTAIIGFLTVIYKSCLASIGNSIVTENVEKNYQDFKKISFICFWLFGICIVCFLCLFQPFMEIWVGKDLLLSFGMIVLFCVYFYAYELMNLFSMYKDAAGIWHQDRYRPLIEAGCNLFMNLIFVNVMGLYGILLSTILSMLCVSLPWLYRNLFKYVFKRKSQDYTVLLLKSTVVIAVVSVGTCFCCMNLPNHTVLAFVFRILICILLSNTCYIFIFSRFYEFGDVFNLINRVLRGRINFLKPILKIEE